jgi:hypothetical protein
MCKIRIVGLWVKNKVQKSKLFSHFVHFTVEFNEFLMSLLLTSFTDKQGTLTTTHTAYLRYYAYFAVTNPVLLVLLCLDNINV